MKEPGIPMPGVYFPKTNLVMFYLFVLGAAGAALVPVSVLVPVSWLHPANTLMRPNSATRVINLFIIGVTFTTNYRKTSQN